MADFNLGRLRFVWKGNWALSTAYVRDDVVKYGGSSYVCVTAHTSVTSFATNSSKFELMTEGGTATTTLGDISYRGSSADQRLAIGTAGQALMVSNSGVPAWTGLVEAQNVYYVSEDGNNANDGKNLNKAFKTINYACSQVVGPAVIFVKTGVYQEQLPIVVPPNVSVYGDGQRTTEVQPVNITATGATRVATTGSGTSTTIIVQNSQTTGNEWQVGAALSGTGISGTVNITAIATNTPTSGFTTLTVSFTNQVVSAGTTTITSNYSEGTMWQLSTASMLHKMFFSGMTGFSPSLSAPEDIREAQIKGIYVAFNPASPITTKSPYVLECSCFSEGGIGAIVDGTVHATGYKSMVFHAYTCVNSDGVGFWVNGDGKAEIVSCFTYYNWIGYTTTNGGKIRSLNGNNSYGRYGAVSKGFDVAESTINGTVYGNQLEYTTLSLVGEFLTNETITGASSGAVGTITNVQTSVHKLYYKITSGTFTAGETITGGTSGATATIAAGGVTGQKGFVLVLTGMASEPKIGGSIEFNTGDTGTYVIQSVSGTYTNSSSKLVLVLAGEKVTASTDGTGFKIRYNFSQTRLQGHDFLNIGTGNRTQTNYPGVPSILPSQANEVIETYPGRVFYVSTDQDGNFRVGDYFKVDQATGRATLNANAFDLSGLTSLRLGSIGAQLGELVNEFSSDDTLSGNSNQAVPTEAAVRNYFPHVATSIIPSDDNSRDLGSPSKRWAHVYVGPGSVTIGSLTLTDNSGAFTVSSSNATPPTLSVPEINTGSIRYFQNNIIGGNSNEDIVIDTSGTGKLQVLADLNMTGTLSGPATFTIDPAAVGDNTGTVVIKGSLQVDGTTTTVNSATLAIDDKNIELGSVTALTSISGTISGTSNTTTITGITTTTGMLIGQALTKASGTGAFGSTPVITSVDSQTQITITSGSANTAGAIVFDVGGATNLTADGAGITIKGTTDKTFNYVNSTAAFTSSENIALASGKTLTVNGNTTLASGSLTFSGSISAPAWTTSGIRHISSPATLTDTTSSGTVANAYTNNFGGNTIAASNATTYTNYATAFFNNPTAGSNVTFTNSYSLITAGAVLLGGDLVGAATQNLLNTGSTTVTAFGAATTATVGYGSTSGSTINISTGAVGSGNTKTVNIGTGAAAGSTTTINIGTSTGTATAQVYGKLAVMGSSTGSVTFQAAASAGSATYVLPNALPGVTGYALVSDTSGNMSWAAAGAALATDTSTTLYPTMSTSTSGNFTAAKVNTGITFNGTTGVLTTSGGFVESSSIALKENVNPITGALDAIMSLVGVTYDRRDGSKKNEAGLIAEAVEQIIPNIVSKNANGQAEGIYYSKLTAYLVEAIKSLKAEIDPLKEEIKKLKGE